MGDLGLWAVALATAPVLVTVLGSVLTKRAELQGLDRAWRRDTALASYARLLGAASQLVECLRLLGENPYFRPHVGGSADTAPASDVENYLAAVREFEESSRTIELFCGDGLRDAIERLRALVNASAMSVLPGGSPGCSSCGAPNQQGRNFCKVCGAALDLARRDLSPVDAALTLVTSEARRDLLVTRR